MKSRLHLSAITTVALALVIAFGFSFAQAGLQDDDATPEDATPEATPATPEATPEDDDAAEAEDEVTIAGVDIDFDQDELVIPADTDVEVTFVNEGSLEHDWVVPDEDVGTEIIGGGEEETVTVNLPAGEYEYICTVPGHEEAGMVGTLIVE